MAASFPGPAALSSAAAVGPRFSLEEGKHTRVLTIGDWSIETSKRPILNGKEIDAAERSLNALPLPEMTFGNNSLKLKHTNPNRGDIRYEFDAISALAEVATGEGWEERVGGGVLVSMAEKWGRSRSTVSALTETPLSAKPVRPHDWTYSSTYCGHTTGTCLFQPSETHELPLELLARQDPILDRILFYDDVVLFEDELHDNGESTLHVRIRVMPHSFFILSRLFVRVDHVLFRVFDVRVYHKFGSSEIVRECSGMEADYETVKKYLPKPTDLSPLADSNFVYQTLRRASPTPVSGGKPWPGLGRTVYVMNLDPTPALSPVLEVATADKSTHAVDAEVHDARKGIDELSLGK